MRSRPDLAPASAGNASFTRGEWLWLLGITLVAAAYRLVALDQVPPGINQDEALSAWNAWCLLHTGRAMSGEPWPIFHCRNIGDHPTMLFFYVLMPFQKLGGLNVATTRLPIALAGIAATALVGLLGGRLFRPRVGLVAAAIFAVSPWTTFIGRLGVGAGITPLQALLPVLAMLYAGFPVADGAAARPRIGWAFFAGLSAGLAGYGFHSLRIHMPLLIAGLLLVSPSGMKAMWRAPGGRAAMIALAAGFLIAFGPLAFVSATDPDMMKRWEMTRLWKPGDGIATIFGLVAQRYFEHFGPGFLFVHGDNFQPFRPLGQGEFGWYMLPGLIAGAVLVLLAVTRSRSVRTLLLLVLLYPIGDLVSRNDGPHLLRSSSGVIALVLLAAWGMVEALRRLQRWSPRAAIAAAAVLLFAAAAQESLYAKRYFRDFPRVWENQIDYQGALLEAARWVRPKLAGSDAVFCTTTGMTAPFVVMLVGLQYDAAQWFRDSKDIRADEFDRYVRFGKVIFNHQAAGQPYLQELTDNGRKDRVIFIVRPGEFGLTDPVKIIPATTGEEMLWICEREI